VQVTVLGKSPSWQDVGGACSGYLVRDGRTAVVIDMGNGAFSELRRHVDYVDVHGVVVSHMHADHFLDLVPYSYALTYAPRQQPVAIPPWWDGNDHPAKPSLHVPVGGRDVFRRVVGAWGNEDLVENAFALTEYSPQDEVQVGTMSVRFHPVPHYLPTHAIEISSSQDPGERITYGADCSPNAELVEFARGTDLLIIEATLPRPERDGERGHLTPGEAGEHGRQAGAKRLILTHISDEMDADWAREEAERAFGAPVEVARHGATYDL
jgi:ribonuclease BN (tRNA processing enzyme)